MVVFVLPGVRIGHELEVDGEVHFRRGHHVLHGEIPGDTQDKSGA